MSLSNLTSLPVALPLPSSSLATSHKQIAEQIARTLNRRDVQIYLTELNSQTEQIQIERSELQIENIACMLSGRYRTGSDNGLIDLLTVDRSGQSAVCHYFAFFDGKARDI